MRLPLVSPIESRDGTVEKDALCKNLLIDQDIDPLAVVRPGLDHVTTTLTPTTGNGIVDFNGELLSVFDSQLAIADTTAEPTISFAQLTNIDDSSAFSGYHEFIITDISTTATVEGYSNIVVTGYGTITDEGFASGFRWEETTGMVSLGEPYSTSSANSYLFDESGRIFATQYLENPIVPIGEEGWWLYRYTTTGGIDPIVLLPNGYYMTGLSPFAHACCGKAGTTFASWRWSETTGYEVLAIPAPYTHSFPNDISDDGEVIVGWYGSGTSSTLAYRWTSATGMVDIGDLGYVGAGKISRATNVSSDGTIVYGVSHDASKYLKLFRWTQATGIVNLAASENFDTMTVNDVTPDGAVVIGLKSDVGNATSQAFRWGNGVFTIITLPGQSYSTAFGVSDDGSIVFGYAIVSGVNKFWRWVNGAITIINIPAAYDTFYFDKDKYAKRMAVTSDGLGMVADLIDTGIEQVPLVYGGMDVLPRFRDLVDLSDEQMDFAQSTL